jgi:hypothetical protein
VSNRDVLRLVFDTAAVDLLIRTSRRRGMFVSFVLDFLAGFFQILSGSACCTATGDSAGQDHCCEKR